MTDTLESPANCALSSCGKKLPEGRVGRVYFYSYKMPGGLRTAYTCPECLEACKEEKGGNATGHIVEMKYKK